MVRKVIRTQKTKFEYQRPKQPGSKLGEYVEHLDLNDEFIAAMKAQGRQIKDIGPDFSRRLQNRIDQTQGKGPSSVYGTERRDLLNYENYDRLYERTGIYQGGVLGFDN